MDAPSRHKVDIYFIQAFIESSLTLSFTTVNSEVSSQHYIYPCRLCFYNSAHSSTQAYYFGCHDISHIKLIFTYS